MLGVYDALDSHVGYKIELTALKVIRSGDAAAMVAAADPRAPQAPAGKEYMLVKFHAKALASNGGQPVEVASYRFSFVSEKGVTYDNIPYIDGLDAEFQQLYAGGEEDGYTFNLINQGGRLSERDFAADLFRHEMRRLRIPPPFSLHIEPGDLFRD